MDKVDKHLFLPYSTAPLCYLCNILKSRKEQLFKQAKIVKEMLTYTVLF